MVSGLEKNAFFDGKTSALAATVGVLSLIIIIIVIAFVLYKRHVSR